MIGFGLHEFARVALQRLTLSGTAVRKLVPSSRDPQMIHVEFEFFSESPEPGAHDIMQVQKSLYGMCLPQTRDVN